ncbi:MAG: hypothetical protein Q7T79_01785 [bacterium]|nr:hypothetical protein [bacterium]
MIELIMESGLWDEVVEPWSKQKLKKVSSSIKEIDDMLAIFKDGKFEKKETVFDLCGNCHFACSYKVPRGYPSVFACGFLEMVAVEGDENYFDTPCFLGKLSQETKESLIEKLMLKEQQLLEKQEEIEEALKKVQK